MYLLCNGYKQFNQPRAICSELCLLLDLVHLMKILHTEQEAFNFSMCAPMTTSHDNLDPLLVLGDTSGNRWIFFTHSKLRTSQVFHSNKNNLDIYTSFQEGDKASLILYFILILWTMLSFWLWSPFSWTRVTQLTLLCVHHWCIVYTDLSNYGMNGHHGKLYQCL